MFCTTSQYLDLGFHFFFLIGGMGTSSLVFVSGRELEGRSYDGKTFCFYDDLAKVAFLRYFATGRAKGRFRLWLLHRG